MQVRLVFAAVIVLAASSSFACAETAAETVAKWGLTGVWSADCDTFPAEGNTYLRVTVASGGRTLLEYDSGKAHERNEIVAAKIAANLSLTVRVRFARQPTLREINFIKAMPRVIRVLQSRAVGGGYTVKDGKIVATREQTLWQIRCY